MKFGKELLRASAACETIVNPDWWLDYKGLKKMLKHNPMEEDSPTSNTTTNTNTSACQKERITKSEVERNFFLALQAELRKVDTHFSQLKSRALESADLALRIARDGLRAEQEEEEERRQHDALRLCTDAHLLLLIVENFGVLNYCGFKKILKKHDKLRGVRTQNSYMTRMVNNKSFSNSPEFRPLLERLEAQYEALTRSLATRNAGKERAVDKTMEEETYKTHKKELEEIAVQGSDRLKSLATIVVSMDEDERKLKRLREEGEGGETSPSPEPDTAAAAASTTTTTTSTATAAASPTSNAADVYG